MLLIERACPRSARVSTSGESIAGVRYIERRMANDQQQLCNMAWIRWGGTFLSFFPPY